MEDPRDTLINDLIRTKQPAPQPDLDNSARVKELGRQVEILSEHVAELLVKNNIMKEELKTEQTKRHEMGKRMRERLMQAWLAGSHYWEHAAANKAAEEYADKIMKGEGNE